MTLYISKVLLRIMGYSTKMEMLCVCTCTIYLRATHLFSHSTLHMYLMFSMDAMFVLSSLTASKQLVVLKHSSAGIWILHMLHTCTCLTIIFDCVDLPA